MNSKALVLSADRITAIYVFLFFTNRELGLERPLSEAWIETEILPDTDAHLPVYARSGWAATGPWGETQHGSRWPARHWVEYAQHGADR